MKGKIFSDNVAFATDLDDPLSSHLLGERRRVSPNRTSSLPLDLLVSILEGH